MANNAEQLLEAQLKASMVSETSSDYNSGSKKLLIDLLYDKFGADDLVKIKNFTNKPTGWVYSDKKSLKIEQPNEFTRRVWQGEQKTRVLKAGETVIVPGWEAYVGLNRFFNQYIQDNFPGELSIRMNSPIEHEKFVDKAFAGVYDPNEPEEEKNVREEVENDLGLVSEDDKKEAKSEVKEGEKAKAK